MPPPSGIDFVDKRGPAIHAIASRGLRGTPSPLPYLKEIQSSFGRHDVGHVQAFSGARARSASRAIGAEAYTRGSQVAFSRTPSLHTAAHEAAHTVQQRAGVQLKGGVGEAGDVYERHADAVADKVVQGKSAEGLLSLFAPRIHAPRAPAVQGEWISRHKDRSSLHRYWKKVDEDSEDRKSGWYKRTDGKGGWDKDNIELGQDGGFATEETLLP
ncbi:MAG: DUF4157 domain-containing protein, partial [Nannocystaceae bacterium]